MFPDDISDNIKFPTFRCFIDKKINSIFFCPYCQIWHTHGVKDGIRTQHCHPGLSPLNGYIIKTYNKQELREIKHLCNKTLKELNIKTKIKHLNDLRQKNIFTDKNINVNNNNLSNVKQTILFEENERLIISLLKNKDSPTDIKEILDKFNDKDQVEYSINKLKEKGIIFEPVAGKIELL